MIEKKRSEYASVRASFEGLFDDRRIRIFSDPGQSLSIGTPKSARPPPKNGKMGPTSPTNGMG